jgi:phage gp29-like protein
LSRRNKRKKNRRKKAQQDFVAQDAQKPPEPYVGEIGIVTSDPDFYPAFGGLLDNPDEVLKQHGARDVRLYRDLFYDDEVKAGIEDRALQVTSEDWEIVPAGDDTEVAEFVDKAIRSSNFILSANIAIQRMILYGYHVQEVMPVQRDGQWVIDKFFDKNPWRFRFAIDRSLRMLTKSSMLSGVPVPDYKFQVYTWADTDQMYGDGLGKYLYRYAFARKNIHNFWTYFLDKFSQPSIIGKYRKTGNEKQDAKVRSNILAAIQAIRQQTGVVLNEGDFIELLEIKDQRGSSASHKDAAEYFGKCIRKIIQLQTLTTDIGSTGSYAASETHDGGRQKQKENTAVVHEISVNNIVRWLVDVNFWGRKEYPQFRWITEKEEVQKELAETYDKLNNQLRGSGKQIDPDFIAEKFNIKLTDYIAPVTQGPTFSEKTVSPEQQAIDDHVGALVKTVDLSGNEDKIMKFVQGWQGDFTDLPEALLELYPGMDMDSLRDAAEVGALNGQAHGRRVVQLQKEEEK